MKKTGRDTKLCLSSDCVYYMYTKFYFLKA